MIQTMLMMKTSQSEQPVGEDEGVEGVGCLAVSHLKDLSFIFLPPGILFCIDLSIMPVKVHDCLDGGLDDDHDDHHGGLA